MLAAGATFPQSPGASSGDGDVHPDAQMQAAARVPHTWSSCPGEAFQVRQGPNYASTGKKGTSGPAIYEVIAADTYQSEQKLPHLARVTQLPEAAPSTSELPPLLIINWMIPNYPPGGLMASKRSDGPGWNLVIYCRLSAWVREALEQGGPQTPGVDLFRRFIHPTEGVALRKERLKMIMGLTDVDEPGFNVMTKALVRNYNCKPFLSKTASSFYLVPGVRVALPGAPRCVACPFPLHLSSAPHPPPLNLSRRGARARSAQLPSPNSHDRGTALVHVARIPPYKTDRPTRHRHLAQKYLEIDVDIHTWGSAALNGFNTVKSRMSAMLGRAGVVIQAEGDEEMPEQMLCGNYLTYLDPLKAVVFDPALSHYLSDERNFVPPLPGSLGRD